MPHLDRFAMSELASESEPLQDFSEEQAARLSAERELAARDRREGRGGRGVRRPGALMDDDGASLADTRAAACPAALRANSASFPAASRCARCRTGRPAAAPAAPATRHGG